LAWLIEQICVDNNISRSFFEFYAGGAAVGLHLLIRGIVDRIVLNDLDKGVYAFWRSVVDAPGQLCRKIQRTEISVDEWKKQKEIYRNKDKNDDIDLLDLGFATLFLNRTNYSGILTGGMIGGINQAGKYKINCRFNKQSIIEKIKTIADYDFRIKVMRQDALELVKSIGPLEPSTYKGMLYYFDPPYFNKGQSLYMNYYKPNDHLILSEAIKSIKSAPWVVSYDDVPDINELYDDCNSLNYQLPYCPRSSRVGKERIFFSRGLVVGSELKTQLVGA
jgi:DNA adenine methylase